MPKLPFFALRPIWIGVIFWSLVLACAGAAEPNAQPVIKDFSPQDATRDKWRAELGAAPQLGQIDAAHGESLLIPVAFPAPVRLWREGGGKAVRLALEPTPERPALVFERFTYEVFVPTDLPAGVRVQARLLLKDKDGLWFEALGRRIEASGARTPATALQPGWNQLEVDLSEGSPELRPRDHQAVWSRCLLAQVAAVGFSFQADRPYAGRLAVDNVAVYPALDRPGVGPFAAPLALTDFVAPEQAKRGELVELSCALNRPVLNPFDPDEIDLQAHFRLPGAAADLVVPAFYWQDYRREAAADRPDGEAYLPVGPGRYKVRFTPPAAGECRYRLEAVYRSPISGREERLTTGERRLSVAEAPFRGFVRRNPDQRNFEFDNGDFFFPLGHSFRSPTDQRHVEAILRRFFPNQPAPVNRGLGVYETLLPRMAAAGINCFEVWMCSWWLGLEWTSRWPGYYGLGRYNLTNAWKLDRLVELAAQNGLLLHLVIDNHGKAAERMGPGDVQTELNRRGLADRQDDGAKQERNNLRRGQVDTEWAFSPYNVRNRADGGFLPHALELFADARAKASYRKKLRYIAARWGWATNLVAFELWSELDLVGPKYGRHRDVYATPAVRGWHREMAGVLRRYDQGRHLIITHYSGDFQYVDPEMVKQDEIEYLACDAYHAPNRPLLDLLRDTQNYAAQFKKPYWITEFGGDWNATNVEGLKGDLYSGLWWGWLSRSAGTPLYWWFEFIDQENLWPAFRALADFTAGEDRRRAPDQPQLVDDWPAVAGWDNPADQRLKPLILGDGRTFYAWVYSPGEIHHLPPPDKQSTFAAARLTVERAAARAYTAEFWDSWTGKVLGRADVARDAKGRLVVPLPEFKVHLAVKLKAKAE